MPTLIGHAVSGIAIGTTLVKKKKWFKVLLAAILCAVIPDADVIGFKFHIAYESLFGHRGFSHSVFFSFLSGAIVSALLKPEGRSEWIKYFFLFSFCTLSHCILDAFTNGGLGVAFFSPFSNERYFFPWHPIEVSPISLKRFLTARGVMVLKSEFQWVVIPSILFSVIVLVFRYNKKSI